MTGGSVPAVEELVEAWTEDGLRLDGVRYGPASADLAVVYTHGATSSVLRPTSRAAVIVRSGATASTRAPSAVRS